MPKNGKIHHPSGKNELCGRLFVHIVKKSLYLHRVFQMMGHTFHPVALSEIGVGHSHPEGEVLGAQQTDVGVVGGVAFRCFFQRVEWHKAEKFGKLRLLDGLLQFVAVGIDESAQGT